MKEYLEEFQPEKKVLFLISPLEWGVLILVFAALFTLLYIGSESWRKSELRFKEKQAQERLLESQGKEVKIPSLEILK